MKIAGTGAVVTGGASGIGRAVAQAIAAAGGRVAIFDLNEAAGRAIASELSGGAIFENVNVADENSVAAAITKTMASFGAIHVCVNCAGIGSAHKTFGKDGPFPLAAWNKTIAVNLTGTFNVARLCGEQMPKNQPLDFNGGRQEIIKLTTAVAFDAHVSKAISQPSKCGTGRI